ncbi:MAG: IS4 family transposase [Verrucomicrobiota bacterium]
MNGKSVELRIESVTKQPLLTDFPTTIFATAKRRLQATIRAARAQLHQESLSGYSVLFQDILPADFLTSIDPTSRQRAYGHLPVFWAWLAQVFEGNASCSRAVSLIQNWCRSAHLPTPSHGTSSYCKARTRIRLSFLKAVHRKILKVLSQRVQEADLWKGFEIKAIDGSSMQLMDTPANQRAYPQPPTQKEGCGFPTMGLVGLLNLSHGGWEAHKTCRWNRHDSRAAASLVQYLGTGDLLLADRAFCTYELIARCQQRGAQVLMRLHQARHKALRWDQGKRISAHERLVTWQRPDWRPGSALPKKLWEKLPSTLQLRLIKLNYENRIGEQSELVLVTTLTDPTKYDGIEMAELYARRWEIEVKLRDLKTTMGLDFLAVKSPRLAHKHLLMGIIALQPSQSRHARSSQARRSSNLETQF